MPNYYAYSPTELPPPADWPDRMHVTGYWFLDPPPGWQPPADLLHFLQAGPAPVSIGFGSMASRDAEATLNLVLTALELSGQRGVLLSGWAGIGKGRTSSARRVCRIAGSFRAWPPWCITVRTNMRHLPVHACPMIRFSRAASTTSFVTIWVSLICKIRSICISRR